MPHLRHHMAISLGLAGSILGAGLLFGDTLSPPSSSLSVDVRSSTPKAASPTTSVTTTMKPDVAVPTPVARAVAAARLSRESGIVGTAKTAPAATWHSSDHLVDAGFGATVATPPTPNAPATTPPVTSPPLPPPTTRPPATSPPVMAPPATGGIPAIGTAAWQTAIVATSAGVNQGHPHGVPSSYDWYAASNGPWPKPSNDAAATGWGILYWNADFGNNPGDLTSRVEVSDYHVWLSTTTGWAEIQNGQVGGAAYYESFVGNGSDPIDLQPLNGDAVSVSLQPNRLFHFYPESARPSVPANFTGHWIVTAAARLSNPDPRAHFAMADGLDWWRTPTAPYPENDGAGTSRMMIVPNDGSAVFVGETDLSASQLAANHP